MEFLQRTPFFRLLFPLIIGVILYQYVELFVWSQVVILLLSVGLVLVSFVIQKSELKYKFRWLYGSGIFLFLILSGYFISNRDFSKRNFDNLNKSGIFEIELIESPIEKENSYLCRIKTLRYFDQNEAKSSSGKAIVYFQKDSVAAQLKSGDQLLIEATFNKPDGQVNPAGFNYKEYLNRQGFGATAYIPSYKWKKVGVNTGFSIFRLAENCQKKLLAVYRRFGIEGDEFAVLAALTLGSKDALHPELRQNYTTSGGMHILAVSGLHVGIIFMVLNFLLSFLDKKKSLKILKIILVILLLWAYAFITGLPPSVIRATIMFSMIAIGMGFGRKGQIYNTIFASAFLMLLFNPDFLFDVGFQLSYCAVLSIVYFQPKIAKWFYIKNKLLKWTWDLTAVSIAAQIGTAPLSLFYFHQFANYFLVTNFVAIPFATLIIYTAVALLLSSSVPYLPIAIAFVLQWLLRILNTSIEFIHQMPYSVSVTSILGIQVFLAFGAIVLFALYFNSKNYYSIFGAFLMVLTFVSVNLYVNYDSIRTNQLIVYSDNKNTHIDFIKGKDHVVFTTDDAGVYKLAQSYWLSRKLNAPDSLENIVFSNEFYHFCGKRICVLTNESLKGKIAEQPISVDYLIIGNQAKYYMDQLLKCVSPKQIVVDKTVSKWYADNIEKACNRKGIKYYSIARNGAFVLNIKD